MRAQNCQWMPSRHTTTARSEGILGNVSRMSTNPGAAMRRNCLHLLSRYQCENIQRRCGMCFDLNSALSICPSRLAIASSQTQIVTMFLYPQVLFERLGDSELEVFCEELDG
jgi:hypothetical protein